MSNRRFLELERKLASVQTEFDRWTEASAENGRLRKNHSQIAAVIAQLSGMTAAVEKDLATPGSARILQRALGIELRILEIHRLWDYFRSKLALRYVDWFAPYLTVVDEFAWTCYEPARAAASGNMPSDLLPREPPLVFFNGGSSPYTKPRRDTYEVEDVGAETLNTEAFIDVLRRLPVPVIGIPWHQVTHLPDALSVAHEVGHDVEYDFRLTPTILGIAGQAAPAGRRSAWHRWSSELFGDLYGVLACGPAFVTALADFLAAEAAGFVHATGDPTAEAHPPAAIRIHAGLSVLRRLAFPREATLWIDGWLRQLPSGPGDDYLEDVDAMVGALLAGPYEQFGSKSLLEVLSFGSKENEASMEAVDSVWNGVAPDISDARQLLAAARLCFEKQATVGSGPPHDPMAIIVRRIVDAQDASTRAKIIERPIDVEAHGRAGLELLRLIDQVHATSGPPAPNGPNRRTF